MTFIRSYSKQDASASSEMPGSFLDLYFSKGTNSHFQTAYLPAKLYVWLIFPQLHKQ